MKAAVDRPLNITFVIPYFYPAWQYGGQPRSAYEKRGHHVKVLTTDSAGDHRLPTGHSIVDGIDVIYYRNFSNWLAFRQRLFWPAAMFRELDRQLAGSDILHIHELRSTLSVPARNAARRIRLPFVISGHGGLRRLGKERVKFLFDAFWGSKLLRDAAAVIAVSPIEEADAVSMKVQRQRIYKLPNMISVDDYKALPPKGLLRKKWQLGPGKVILFLGRLHWIKGADLLIEAFSAMQDRHADVRLVISGSDDGMGAALRSQVRKLKLQLQHSVVFTGFLDHRAKLEALVDSDLLVVPSRSEVFAINVLDALMCACPVLLSDSCGLYPMPKPNQGVRLFKNGDVRALTQAICDALSATALADAARNGPNFVGQEFASDHIAGLAESIYRTIIHKSIVVH